mmetsp:Transcript_3178/g.6609  ORF Transcript_3178/g.6609 Transcript_3178/m.6609 type:complete len:235 (+) Transcript_3178:138-842(+)
MSGKTKGSLYLQDMDRFDPDSLFQHERIVSWKLVQPLHGLESRDNLGKAGFVLVKGGIILRVDIKGGRPDSGKPNSILFVGEFRRVFDKGHTFKILFVKLHRLAFCGHAVVVRHGCRLERVLIIRNKGAALDQSLGYHFQKGIDGMWHQIQRSHFHDNCGGASVLDHAPVGIISRRKGQVHFNANVPVSIFVHGVLFRNLNDLLSKVIRFGLGLFELFLLSLLLGVQLGVGKDG